MIDVQEISPIRIQHSDRLVFPGVIAHDFYIAVRVLIQRNQMVPAAYTRAEILDRSGRIERPRLILPLVFRVSPV